MDIFFSIIKMFGGLGMFLYGMNAMSSGLERVAGNKMKMIIEKVTGNIFKSVILGIIVAALTQSSSATTVMVVGFVNAGVMSLPQAAGVIMGANIGTTITAWILSLSSIEGGVWYLDIIKPDNLAPIALFIGSFLMLIGGKESRRANFGSIVVGFGIIFIGMKYMQESIGENPIFMKMFSADVNPLVGVCIGAGVTAIIQSSAASVGMLQAVANMGILTFSTAFPIIMGQNIGTCVTAMLSSIGASKNAKRAAMLHLYFNVIGTVVFMLAIYILKYTVGLSFWDETVSAANISTFHSIFNVTNTLIMLPFTGALVKLANFSISDKEPDRRSPASLIDDRFLSTPSVAILQTKKAMIGMAKIALENVTLCRDMIKNKNFKLKDKLKENEAMLDDLEIELSNYLTNLSDRTLSMQESQEVAGYFHMVNDIERIGDYCENIMQSALEMRSGGFSFTDDGNRELGVLFKSVENITRLTIEAFERDDVRLAKKIEPLEEVIDELKEKLGNNHMERLKKRECNVEIGTIYMEILSNLERIADHCSNMGVAMVKQNYTVNDFNTHIYLNTVHKDMPEHYKEDYESFKEEYLMKLNA